MPDDHRTRTARISKLLSNRDALNLHGKLAHDFDNFSQCRLAVASHRIAQHLNGKREHTRFMSVNKDLHVIGKHAKCRLRKLIQSAKTMPKSIQKRPNPAPLPIPTFNSENFFYGRFIIGLFRCDTRKLMLVFCNGIQNRPIQEQGFGFQPLVRIHNPVIIGISILHKTYGKFRFLRPCRDNYIRIVKVSNVNS